VSEILGAQTARAFHELWQQVRDLDKKFHEGPGALGQELDVLDGYVWITSLLRVALDAYLWADPLRPRFVDIVGPDKKWGGDNADAFYQLAAVDGARRYLVRGRKGDSAYLSFTLYGGPARDGSYGAQRTVATLNDRSLRFEPDGSFEVTLSPDAGAGNHVQLSPDSLFVITRDYLRDPVRGRRAAFEIECLDRVPPPRPTDAETAARFRAAARFLADQASFQPIPLPPANAVQDPAPARAAFGWNAGDAVYAMGSFELEDDQALVLRGRSPECAFWNLTLWNPFLHSYDYTSERVSLNGAQCRHERDGSWTLVVSPRDPGHPNWISTAGRRRGLLWFRWFLAAELPKPLEVALVPLSEVPRAPGA
jgi:hypothetical protein